jgi:hypothetical protein
MKERKEQISLININISTPYLYNNKNNQLNLPKIAINFKV